MSSLGRSPLERYVDGLSGVGELRGDEEGNGQWKGEHGLAGENERRNEGREEGSGVTRDFKVD